jgi:hypothetical protein
MKSFRQYLEERPVKLSLLLPYGGAIPREIRGLDGPSLSDITGFAKNAPQNKLRFLVNSKGKMTVWRAMDGIHQQVITGEGRDDEDFTLGYMTLLKNGDWDVYISPHPKANVKFIKKNDTFRKIMKMTTSKSGYVLSADV